MKSREAAGRLAVLMTCHNRAAYTLDSLAALKRQKPFAAAFDLFLTDDGSTDGTGQSVASLMPGSTIIRGDGNLYWCGGMRLAFEQAMQKGYDFYLWLNDDTRLEDDALQRIFHTYTEAASQLGELIIVVGSTCEKASGSLTYGGWQKRSDKLFTNSWGKVAPLMDRWIACDTMNGNCVLIPRAVVERIGNLDNIFAHSMGDLDYGLRAKKAGCQLVIAPGYYGVCGANDGGGLWSDIRQPLLTRWKKLLGPKGLPVKEWLVFARRHKGRLWVLVWLSPYIMFWVNALLRVLGFKR